MALLLTLPFLVKAINSCYKQICLMLDDKFLYAKDITNVGLSSSDEGCDASFVWQVMYSNRGVILRNLKFKSFLKIQSDRPEIDLVFSKSIATDFYFHEEFNTLTANKLSIDFHLIPVPVPSIQ